MFLTRRPNDKQRAIVASPKKKSAPTQFPSLKQGQINLSTCVRLDRIVILNQLRWVIVAPQISLGRNICQTYYFRVVAFALPKTEL